MAQGQELWELKRLDGRFSVGVWCMYVDAYMHLKYSLYI